MSCEAGILRKRSADDGLRESRIARTQCPRNTNHGGIEAWRGSQETFAKEVRPSSASLIGTIGFLTMKLRNVQGYHLFRIYWNILYRGSIVSFKFPACLSNTTIREGSIAS